MADNAQDKQYRALLNQRIALENVSVPRGTKVIKVLGIEYAYLKLKNGDDMYVTCHGLPLLKALMPEQWYFAGEEEKKKNWERLNGSGTLFRIHNRRSGKGRTDLVAKWNRVGQDVPGRDPDSGEYTEFNSPFEEVSMLMEMRNTRYETPGSIATHKPLAIYVPVERISPEESGRREYKFHAKSKLLDIELDLNRRYIMLYEWVDGMDLSMAADRKLVSLEEMSAQTLKVEEDMKAKGFRDHDRKPNHIIVREKAGGSLLRNKKGEIVYAVIDFEMLLRSPEREKRIKEAKRAEYLVRQRDRFDPAKPDVLPQDLSLVNIFGVDYIYGKVESTGGALWVVGRDPALYDYFLPEKWRRTPRTKISHSNEIYRTTTKDDIHVVWRVSRVGEKPVFYNRSAEADRIVEYGYNSPFEEVALAIELSRKGLPTIYPRVIYRTGYRSTASDYIADGNRYKTHADIVMPDGVPALLKDYNYMTVWGYWNGPDELLAVRDGEYYSGINLLHARNEKIISDALFGELMTLAKEKLGGVGIEDLNPRAEHFIISMDHKGNLILDGQGTPEIRCCNFEFLRKKQASNEKP